MAAYLSAVGGVLNVLWTLKDPIKSQFRYLFRSNIIIEDLRTKAQDLNSSRDHLQQQIEAALGNLHVILPNIQSWCSRVDKLKEKIDRVSSDAQQAEQNGTCLRGMCPNLKVRYSLSRKAMKLTAVVVGLQNEFNGFGSHISDPIPLMEMQAIPTSSNTLEFKSRKLNEEEIMGYLRDDSVHMIGVCGMGGVGKTTMTNKIREMATVENLFGGAVMAVVSQQPNPLKIQQELAKGLGLTLTHEDVSTCATLLYNRLKDKKVLIILDDVWDRLDLMDLGIDTSQNKILITSRDVRVCKMMSIRNATKILRIEELHEDEAFSLFAENVGPAVNQTNLIPLAKELAKECKGLPLAIVTVGLALREEIDYSVWEHSLWQLRHSAPTDIPEYLEHVYQPLKLSYEHLKSDDAKYLFLLCCLFPEDSIIRIEDLVPFCVGLRLLSSTESISNARTKVHYLVNMLINRCLLIVGVERYGYKYVKMHDVIRDMGIHISSCGKHVFLVSHKKNIREWPGKNADEDYTCISVMWGTDMAIWESRNWPRLEGIYMALDFSSKEKELPVDFFSRMPCLKFVRLDYVSLVPLSSLQLLTHLKVLHLSGCDSLKNISSISQLVNLEFLICQGKGIEEISDEFGGLTKLKLLDLSYCGRLRNIAAGVVSKLVQLEELHLLRCPIEWGYEEEGERKNATLAEVFSSRNLKVVNIWIKNSKAIPQVVREHSFTNYSISIGRDDSLYGNSYLKSGRINLGEGGASENVAIFLKLFEDAELLGLVDNGTKELVEKLGRQGFKNVKDLKITRLGRVKYLSNAMYSGIMFPVLRRLELSYMDDLEEIFNGALTVESSLSNLQSVIINRCKNLKWVFPLYIVKSLCQLETIIVDDCPNMEKIFEDDSESTSDIVTLSKLKELILNNLPNLHALCKVNDIFQFPSIKRLEMKNLSSNFENSKPQIRQNKKLKELIMGHHLEKFCCEILMETLTELEVLEISCFPSLKTLFSKNVFRGLINLRELKVEDCSMLEYICGREDDQNEVSSKTSIVLLPKLEVLQLLTLPKIRYFCSLGSGLTLPSLSRVFIKGCPEMKAFDTEWSSSTSTSSCSNISNKFFFNKQVSLPALYSLTIEGSHNIQALFTPPVFQSLTSLQHLRLMDCVNLEYVIGKEELDVDDEGGLDIKHICGREVDDNEVSGKTSILLLPKLRLLNLIKLPKIRYFCSLGSGLDLPKLLGVTIRDCPEMETFGKGWSSSTSTSTSTSTSSCSNISNKYFFNKQVSLPSLFELRIEGSHNIQALFTLPVSQSLLQLTIEDCVNLEYVIGKEEVDVDDEGGLDIKQICGREVDDNEVSGKTSILLLPKLKVLELKKLPKIRYFCSLGSGLDLPSLYDVNIRDCPEMETFGKGWSSSTSTSTSSCSNISNKYFFNKQVSLPALYSLRIEGSHNIQALFTPPVFQSLTSLEGLIIEDCLKLEYVIGKEEVDIDHEGGLDIKHIFRMPDLIYLELLKLPKMHKFSNVECGLEFPIMEWIKIYDCNEMMSFGVGLRMLVSTGIRIYGFSDPNLASEIFNNIELREHEGPEEWWIESFVNDGGFILTSSDLLFTWDSDKKPSLLPELRDMFVLHGWIKVTGKFEIEKLVSGSTYKIVFLISLLSISKSNLLRECLEFETSLADEKHVRNMENVKTEMWIEIEAGKFSRVSDQNGEITFSLQRNFAANGVVLKGVFICPENIRIPESGYPIGTF